MRMASFAGDKKYRSKADGPRQRRNGEPPRPPIGEECRPQGGLPTASQQSGSQLERRSKGACGWRLFCRRQKKDAGAKRTLLRRGAEGGTRTHTVSLPTDFESVTSAIPSLRHKYKTEYTMKPWKMQEQTGRRSGGPKPSRRARRMGGGEHGIRYAEPKAGGPRRRARV